MSKLPELAVAGFVALDIVIDEAGERPAVSTQAGGTACNVAAITAFLGISVALLGEIGLDDAGDAIVKELSALGVDLRGLRRRAGSETPIVVERLRLDGRGEPHHRFELRCKECGKYFPRFRSASLQTLEELSSGIVQPAAFFFDRVSAGIVALARRFRAEGALVVFEPSRADESKLFLEAVRLSDIVKFSVDRLEIGRLPVSDSAVSFVVETRGAEGLTLYHRSGRKMVASKLSAVRPTAVRDTTGSGDWLTAGMLALFSTEKRRSRVPTRSGVIRALRFGQALAALSVSFVGARGLMSRRAAAEVASIEVPAYERPKQWLAAAQGRLEMVVERAAIGCHGV